MRREEFTNEVLKLLNGSRAEDYGDAATNFKRIAAMWSMILGMRISSRQVGLCMMALKLSRLIHEPKHTDSLIDISGSAALPAELED